MFLSYHCCIIIAENDTYSFQHRAKVLLLVLVDEEEEVVDDVHLEDLVGVLLLELSDQRTACVLDEPVRKMGSKGAFSQGKLTSLGFPSSAPP